MYENIISVSILCCNYENYENSLSSLLWSYR